MHDKEVHNMSKMSNMSNKCQKSQKSQKRRCQEDGDVDVGEPARACCAKDVDDANLAVAARGLDA